MYKYNCRKCPIRNRCIGESDTSPSAKEMIRNAFAARTDTLSTWGVLQKNCLLIKAEERRAKIASEESLLSRRLREVRQNKKATAEAQDPDSSRATPDYLRPVTLRPLSSKSRPPVTTADLSERPVEEAPATRTGRLRQETEPARPCWFTANGSNRHINLPAAGELVFGRFDPQLGVPPDIDLAYEDWDQHTVSRRHVRIVGREGYHTVEDLGSRNGLFINDQQIPAGTARPIQPGDRVHVGGVLLVYDIVPTAVLTLRPAPSDRHTLLLAANGRRLSVSPPHEITIGRSDRHVDFRPDIDLGEDGEVAMRVSRRHAVISWRQASPYLEDLGSGFGTRLNGQTLLIGQGAPLRPGDHIWLGGCVLAYDIEI